MKIEARVGELESSMALFRQEFWTLHQMLGQQALLLSYMMTNDHSYQKDIAQLKADLAFIKADFAQMEKDFAEMKVTQGRILSLVIEQGSIIRGFSKKRAS